MYINNDGFWEALEKEGFWERQKESVGNILFKTKECSYCGTHSEYGSLHCDSCGAPISY